jgi:hypothetical protein
MDTRGKPAYDTIYVAPLDPDLTRSFDTPLPIDTVLDDLAGALAGNNTAVLVAPPGAGKTTRVPLALLDAPWIGTKKIIMLEPRRIAARASRRLPGAVRLESVARDAYRGGHRRHLLAADSRRSGIDWHCRRLVR